MDYYDLTLCRLKRRLPLIQISKNTKIASFSILGDTQLVIKLSNYYYNKLKNVNFDFLIGPEVKIVPLLQSLSEKLGHQQFIVCRKSVKPYMNSPIIIHPLSHFPKHSKPLVLNGPDAILLKNKRVIIIDDVVSTGVTMRMMNYLLEKTSSTVIARHTIIKQGKQFDNFENFHFIKEIPIFKTQS